jgi:ABC-2 type transport system ATP-binding protein
MTSAISVENLVKRFRGVEALRGLNLEVSEGSIYALVGPNGAGKTTLIKVLMNIIAATSGRAEVLGEPSSTLFGRKLESVGYVSENQKLPEWMRVDNFFAYLRPFYPTWDTALETDLLRKFDLPLNRKLKSLSRGMRMKAALASALAYRPKLIVLDEPFSGLDPLVRDELIEALLDCAEHTTVFISSHDLAEIETFASHVGYLDHGELQFSEEMSVLAARFREVEFAVHDDVAAASSVPRSWIRIECAGDSVRFVESAFDPSSIEQQIRASFGEFRDLSISPMPLREIFVSIAKSRDGRKERVLA